MVVSLSNGAAALVCNSWEVVIALLEIIGAATFYFLLHAAIMNIATHTKIDFKYS
jgi:hypothetical protein